MKKETGVALPSVLISSHLSFIVELESFGLHNEIAEVEATVVMSVVPQYATEKCSLLRTGFNAGHSNAGDRPS